MRHSLCLLLTGGLLLLTAAPGVRGDDNADAGFVAKDDKLPNAVVRSDWEIAQIKPFLAKLPEGHRLRLEFVTAYKVQTGKPEDERSICLVTPVDAKDKPDGQETALRGNRVIRTTEYSGGVRQGVERMYDADNGALVGETPWEKGIIQGVKRTFHPNGKLATESTYEKGVIVGQSRSYDAGAKLIRVVSYVAGKRDGETIDYWSDKPDVVQRIVPYKKDLVDGVAKSFYLSGKIKWERPFRNNRQQGIETQYAGDGAVQKTLYWLDGTQVPEGEYRAKVK